MKECLNCHSMTRTTDKYCRNCGCYQKSAKDYIITSVLTIFMIIGIVFIIVLFFASYMVTK